MNPRELTHDHARGRLDPLGNACTLSYKLNVSMRVLAESRWPSGPRGYDGTPIQKLR